jgi:hypothetical protein
MATPPINKQARQHTQHNESGWGKAIPMTLRSGVGSVNNHLGLGYHLILGLFISGMPSHTGALPYTFIRDNWKPRFESLYQPSSPWVVTNISSLDSSSLADQSG